MAYNHFLDNVGLDASNSLTHLLNEYNTPTDDEVNLISNSLFYSEDQFIDIHSHRTGLSILSLNIRSINANYTEFKLFIDRVNSNNPLSVICLNECWLEATHNMSDFYLPGYSLFHTTEKCCGHGGLMIYVHDQFSAKPLKINEDIHGWERQCIQLSHKSKNSKVYTICNIYKPPNQIADDFHTFVREYSNTLSFLSTRHRSAYICGDFNIDLLQININQLYSEFFDTVISSGFIPMITLPTRISETGNRSTLIDNIFTNVIDRTEQTISGNLLIDITDHKAIFTSVNDSQYKERMPKHIEIEVRDEHSMTNFINELKNLDIHTSLNDNLQSDPNDNYEIFEKLIIYAKNKHIPKKTVKYRKQKHKQCKWMTDGILNSINTKDKLYKIMVQADNSNPDIYNALKVNFKTYKNILRHNIREAKKQYYTRTFLRYKDNIKKTWGTINDTLNRNNNSKDIPSVFIITTLLYRIRMNLLMHSIHILLILVQILQNN